ncbi:MAG: NAD(P)H-quinone oxidoreductase, partial [Planktomarina sp.]|jgi:NADPH2:quinone reductase|nr:NAD(P)H-quinone oxidoreductase [Planktomarina sp.]|tara:strand:+ start:812 stop:1780 length:969 start_codon:yes stop_codon:yes gene_type:complete
MKAINITKAGGPDVLQLTERPVPLARHGEVVIKLAYAGVNRPDALQRAGLYKPPSGASDLPGLEGAGTIYAVGAGVTDWAIGDEVCALLPGGGYAEYVATQAFHCLPVPKGLSLAQAACLPETYFTVYSNVFQRGGLKSGEKFMVHGGSSGIGTTAIQLANLFGARVIATAGSEAKCQACKNLGAERVVNYRSEAFEDVVKTYGGVDLILDMVGGEYIQRNLNSLADDGRLVQIAFLQGPKVELNLVQLLSRRLKITGSTLRPQSDLAKASIRSELLEKIWPHLEAGRIAPVMDSEFPLSEAAEAHRLMESSQHIGKIVLKI